MQCSNCHFENMPGVQICGRCGGSLQLAALELNVYPPRASRAAKLWRRWFPLSRLWWRFKQAIPTPSFRWKAIAWPADIPEIGVLLRAIVPGWPQRALGRPTRGKMFFWSYLGLLSVGLITIGAPLSWLILGLAISLHAASIVDLLAASIRGHHQWLLTSLAVVAILTGVVYYPAYSLFSDVAAPVRFGQAAAPFEPGDVVLVNHAIYRLRDPRPGDVVMYDLPQGDMRLYGGAPHGRIYRMQGSRIDRILAVAGQKVTYHDGELLVDGELSPWLPLNLQQVPNGLDVTVPEGCYLILPSGDPATYPLQVWNAVSAVHRSRIHGVAYLQNNPLWRFGRIH